MGHLAQDLRYALRGFRRTPGFTLVALLTLALGIGVNSSIFSVVNAVLFRPLPVQQPKSLVDIYGQATTESSHGTSSYPNYLSIREQVTTLQDVVGYANFFANFSLNNSSEIVIGEMITANYFSTLGIPLAKGRAFSDEETTIVGAGPVAIISDRMWQTRFGASENVLGQTFRMNGQVYTIVGVAPRNFGGMIPAVTAQMWIPVSMVEEVEPIGNLRFTGTSAGANRLERRGQHWLWLKGRMRDGTTPMQVREELSGIMTRLASEFPATNSQERVVVVPSTDVRINPDFDRVLGPVGFVLLAAVGLVLIVACANLANLLLARAAGRRREIAVRLAVGASRKRLVQQLLTESLLLAIAGGALAIPLAFAFAKLVAGLQPPLPLDFGFQVTPDWRVLTFTMAVAVITGVLFGLAPAMRATNPNLVPALRNSTGNEGRRRHFELRNLLVVMQVAVSLVLVVGGALLVRSFSVATRIDLGFDPDRIAHAALALEMTGYDAERGGVFLATAKERLQALPGVEAVGQASRLPQSINNNGFTIVIPGHQQSESDRPFAIDGASIDEHYFDALGVALVAGRNLQPLDRDSSQRVVVITRAMAERFWSNAEGAVGREIRLRWGGQLYRVVGVVENYKVNTPGESSTSYIHLPMARNSAYGNFVIRTSNAAAPMVPVVERTIREIDPEVVIFDRGTLRGLSDVRLFPVRAGAWMIGAFGTLALVVAAIGLYGVIGYSVSRRTHELGVRKALGAQSGQLVSMVIREGMMLVAIGGVIGVVLAVLGARALSSVLFVDPLDVVSFGSAFAVLAIVALAANAVPALRASRVDAMEALREQ